MDILTFDLDGCTTVAGRAGSGAPLVLIHGLGGSHEDFAPVERSLSARFALLMPDLPPFGGSACAGDWAPSMAGWARMVADACDRLAWSRVVVLGFSMGGAVAMQLARDYPRLVRGLILCSTSVAVNERGQRFWLKYADAIEGEGAAAVRRFMEGTYTPGFLEAHREARERFERRVGRVRPEAYAAVVRSVFPYDYTETLRALGAPLLAIAGSGDPLTPPAAARGIAALPAHAAAVEVPDAAHQLFEESPDRVVAEVGAFIDRLPEA